MHRRAMYQGVAHQLSTAETQQAGRPSMTEKTRTAALFVAARLVEGSGRKAVTICIPRLIGASVPLARSKDGGLTVGYVIAPCQP